MSQDKNKTVLLPQMIAKNISDLRKAHGMTQAELAERLGYSDKSVSKWERADGVPDVICLKNIADLFGVTVDYFLEAEHEARETDENNDSAKKSSEPAEAKESYVTNRRVIVLLSIAGVWLLACVVFVIVKLCGAEFYLPFAAALPVTALLLVIFHAMWSGGAHFRLGSFITVSALVWSLLFLVCYICRQYEPWIIMLLGFPATVVVALACVVRKKAKPDEGE